MNALGNENIKKKKSGIGIKNPAAARDLLDLALKLAKQRQRVIFFCHCPVGKICHRMSVASLLLKEARKRNLDIEVVEWPGGTPKQQLKSDTSDSIIKALRRSKKSFPLGHSPPSVQWLGFAHGSILKCRSKNDRKNDSLLITVDPALRTRSGWYLPVVDYDETIAFQALRKRPERDRRTDGLLPRRSRQTRTK